MADIGWAEYVVFMLVLSVSVGIGVFYGCFGSKQKTTREYLLANRQMPAFPVALSQICTYAVYDEVFKTSFSLL